MLIFFFVEFLEKTHKNLSNYEKYLIALYKHNNIHMNNGRYLNVETSV